MVGVAIHSEAFYFANISIIGYLELNSFCIERSTAKNWSIEQLSNIAVSYNLDICILERWH